MQVADPPSPIDASVSAVSHALGTYLRVDAQCGIVSLAPSLDPKIVVRRWMRIRISEPRATYGQSCEHPDLWKLDVIYFSFDYEVKAHNSVSILFCYRAVTPHCPLTKFTPIGLVYRCF
jgi:hypothetical protein